MTQDLSYQHMNINCWLPSPIGWLKVFIGNANIQWEKWIPDSHVLLVIKSLYSADFRISHPMRDKNPWFYPIIGWKSLDSWRNIQLETWNLLIYIHVKTMIWVVNCSVPVPNPHHARENKLKKKMYKFRSVAFRFYTMRIQGRSGSKHWSTVRITGPGRGSAWGLPPAPSSG